MLVILTKDVSFVDFEQMEVVIPANTTVYLDTANDETVATCAGYNFDVTKDEYMMVQ